MNNKINLERLVKIVDKDVLINIKDITAIALETYEMTLEYLIDHSVLEDEALRVLKNSYVDLTVNIAANLSDDHTKFFEEDKRYSLALAKAFSESLDDIDKTFGIEKAVEIKA